MRAIWVQGDSKPKEGEMVVTMYVYNGTLLKQLNCFKEGKWRHFICEDHIESIQDRPYWKAIPDEDSEEWHSPEIKPIEWEGDLLVVYEFDHHPGKRMYHLGYYSIYNGKESWPWTAFVDVFAAFHISKWMRV